MQDALVAPTNFPRQRLGDISSDASCNTSPLREAGPETLSSSSRELIKQYFSEVTTFRLPPGHSTIALNEGQK